jgi:ArsR family transcriptional regulator
MIKFEIEAKLLKAIADPVRMQIMEMISCQEMHATDVLRLLTISQSTLSHHMKILTEHEIVHARKEGTSIYYSINLITIEKVNQLIKHLSAPKDECVCYE